MLLDGRQLRFDPHGIKETTALWAPETNHDDILATVGIVLFCLAGSNGFCTGLEEKAMSRTMDTSGSRRGERGASGVTCFPKPDSPDAGGGRWPSPDHQTPANMAKPQPASASRKQKADDQKNIGVGNDQPRDAAPPAEPGVTPVPQNH